MCGYEWVLEDRDDREATGEVDDDADRNAVQVDTASEEPTAVGLERGIRRPGHGIAYVAAAELALQSLIESVIAQNVRPRLTG